MRTMLFCLMIFLAPFHAYAEPSKSVAYLMNDSLSMFDWGLYRLEEALEEQEFKDLDLIFRKFSRVEYEWDKNQIAITITIYPSYSSLLKSGPKKICRSALITLKKRYGYGWEEKELRQLVSIKRFFKHKAYVRKDEPETLSEDLETMTKITIQVYASKTNKPSFSEQCSCTSSLMEDDIYFLDKESKDKP